MNTRIDILDTHEFIFFLGKTGLFQRYTSSYPPHIGGYLLFGTDYVITVWNTYGLEDNNGHYNWCLLDEYGHIKSDNFVCFEEVFNSVDDNTRKQLAFHMDLFV